MDGLAKVVEVSLLVLKVLAVVVCLIALTVAGWLVEREINWRFWYKDKIERTLNNQEAGHGQQPISPDKAGQHP